MNHKVHHITGIVIAQTLLLYEHVPALSFQSAGVILCGYMASMVPDLDKPGSFFTSHQPFRAFSELLSRIGVPHRGPTHSIPMLILVYLFFRFVIPLPDVFVWAIVLGWASHIFLDLFNAAGVMLLFPWRFDFKLLPSFMAVSSDDNSIGQQALYAIGTITFYGLMIHTVLDILTEAPIIGGLSAYLNDGYVDKLKPVWVPAANNIRASVHFVQQYLKL